MSGMGGRTHLRQQIAIQIKNKQQQTILAAII
jgi:hypothetical protein